MILLNADFTELYNWIPVGFIVIFVILFVEYSLLKYFLSLEDKKADVATATFFSNLLSAIAGIQLALDGRFSFVQYCLLAFAISVIVETIVNILFLKRNASISKIIKATFLTNLVTNIFASLLIGWNFYK